MRMSVTEFEAAAFKGSKQDGGFVVIILLFAEWGMVLVLLPPGAFSRTPIVHLTEGGWLHIMELSRLWHCSIAHKGS